MSVGAAFGVGDGGDLGRPRAGRGRDEGADPVAEPGVDDGGQVAGAGQVPFGDRGGQDVGGVQAGQFGGAQRPPQPPGLVAGLSPMVRRQGAHEQVPVVLLAECGGLGGPDRVQDGQVIGVCQGMLPGLGRGGLLAVSVQHAGQHRERVAGLGRRGGGVAVVAGGEAVVAGQFGGRARARRRVGAFGGQREHVRHVEVGAAAERDIGVLAVLGAGDHGQAGVHGAALRDVVGDRVAQLGVA